MTNNRNSNRKNINILFTERPPKWITKAQFDKEMMSFIRTTKPGVVVFDEPQVRHVPNDKEKLEAFFRELQQLDSRRLASPAKVPGRESDEGKTK